MLHNAHVKKENKHFFSAHVYQFFFCGHKQTCIYKISEELKIEVGEVVMPPPKHQCIKEYTLQTDNFSECYDNLNKIVFGQNLLYFGCFSVY